MATTLIRNIGALSGALQGVNVFDVAPPASAVGAVNKYVGIVGDFPWGPKNAVTLCTSFADFLATFYPPAFGTPDATTYTAMRAFIGKSFPGPFYVCAIAPSSVAAVQRADVYTVSGGTFTWTAKYPSALAQNITVTFAAATDGDSTHRNITVAIGTTYSVTYTNVTLTSILTLGDPYITWTAGSSPSVLPAAAANAGSTTAGTNGTSQASDFVGSSSSNVGIRKFYASNVTPAVLFVAECPSASINTVNTGLVAFAQNSGKDCIAVLSSVASQSLSTAITYAASYRDTGSRVVGVWPRVKVTNTFDATSPTITVDGNAFYAVTRAAVDPWRQVTGVNGKPYLTAITDLETNDSVDGYLDLLTAAGFTGFCVESTLGPIFGADTVNNLTSGQTDGGRSAYRQYANAYCSAAALQYYGVPLDVNLTAQTLGENTQGLISTINAFFSEELRKGRIRGYSVDPYGSTSTADLAAGKWTIAISVTTYAGANIIILATQYGTTVTQPASA